MLYIIVLVKWLILIAVGYTIFQIVENEYLHDHWVVALIIGIALCKTVYFVRILYKKIEEVVLSNTAFHQFLVFLLVNIFTSVFSFAIDFWCLHQVNDKSFLGVNLAYNKIELVFEFFYFSLLNFSYFGFGAIIPQSIPAKMLIMLQVTLSFLILIFILTDFISLKEGLEGYVKRKKGNK